MFSIIIATHNRPKMLIDAVNSVLLQKLPEVEIVVINDGSTQNYDKTIDSFSALIESGKLKYICYSEALGVSAARNLGVRHSTRPWIVFLDDDDVFAESYLKSLESAIQHDESNSVFYWGNVRILDVNENGVPHELTIEYPEEFPNNEELIKSVTSIGTSYGVAIEKFAFEKIGGFDESFQVCEDLDLIISLLETGANFKPVGSLAVIKHQQHTDRLSHGFSKYSENNVYERIFSKHETFFKYHPDIYLDLYTWSMKVHLQNNQIENILNSIIDNKSHIF